jgi:uncharacterized protein YgiM (DUF1202 family)
MSFLFLLFFVIYYYGETTLLKRIFFIGMVFMIFGIIISVSSAIFEKSNYDNDQPAVVFEEITAVKSEPTENGTTAFMLHEGTKVFVFETVDNFKKIELQDGKKGWIKSSAIKEIKRSF